MSNGRYGDAEMLWRADRDRVLMWAIIRAKYVGNATDKKLEAVLNGEIDAG